jgi:hypothetical protein
MNTAFGRCVAFFACSAFTATVSGQPVYDTYTSYSVHIQGASAETGHGVNVADGNTLTGPLASFVGTSEGGFPGNYDNNEGVAFAVPLAKPERADTRRRLSRAGGIRDRDLGR